MKKLFLTVACVILLLSIVSSSIAAGIQLKNDTLFSDGLLPFSRNNEYGYIDKNGNIIISEKWEDAESFSEGLAAVKQNGKWGYIDKVGNLAISPQWDEAYPFKNGVACIVNGSSMNQDDIPESLYMDLFSGKISYDEFEKLSNGSKQYGLIDKSGKVLAEIKWDKEISFSEGYAVVYKDNKYGFINIQGELIIPCEYNKAVNFRDGFAYVEKGDEKGFIDYDGNMVIVSKWDYCSSFSEGKAVIYKEDIKGNKKYGYIDKDGKIIVDLIYDYAESFSNGLACVKKGKYKYLIDEEGNEVFDGATFEIRNSSGNNSYYESSSLATLPSRIVNEKMIMFEKSTVSYNDYSIKRKYGFIDVQGNVVIPAKYDSIGAFINNRAIVKSSGGKYGYIDMNGKEIVYPRYDKVTNFSDGLAIVWERNSWYIIDDEGNTIL